MVPEGRGPPPSRGGRRTPRRIPRRGGRSPGRRCGASRPTGGGKLGFSARRLASTPEAVHPARPLQYFPFRSPERSFPSVADGEAGPVVSWLLDLVDER